MLVQEYRWGSGIQDKRNERIEGFKTSRMRLRLPPLPLALELDEPLVAMERARLGEEEEDESEAPGAVPSISDVQTEPDGNVPAGENAPSSSSSTFSVRPVPLSAPTLPNVSGDILDSVFSASTGSPAKPASAPPPDKGSTISFDHKKSEDHPCQQLFDEGKQAEDSGNWRMALQMYQIAATEEHPEALMRLSVLLERGKGTDINQSYPEGRRLVQATAAVYLERAINLETFSRLTSNSKNSLDCLPGMFPHLGRSVSEAEEETPEQGFADFMSDKDWHDDDKAWLQSHRENVRPCFKLAQTLDSDMVSGETLAQRRLRFAEAAYNYEINGSSEALFRIGRQYALGRGIDVSERRWRFLHAADVQSLIYLDQVIEVRSQKCPRAKFLKAILLFQGRGVPYQSRADRATAVELAVVLAKSAASDGFPPAMVLMAQVHEFGVGLLSHGASLRTKNLETAQKCYQLAAKLGYKPELAKRADVLRRMATRQDILENPATLLIVQRFRAYVTSHMQPLVMCWSIHEGLQRFSSLKSFQFTEIADRINRVKQISEILLSTNGQPTAAFEVVPPELDSQKSKSHDLDNMRQINILQQLRQLDTSWTKAELATFLNLFQKQLKRIKRLSIPFEETSPVEAVHARLSKISLKQEKITFESILSPKSSQDDAVCHNNESQVAGGEIASLLADNEERAPKLPCYLLENRISIQDEYDKICRQSLEIFYAVEPALHYPSYLERVYLMTEKIERIGNLPFENAKLFAPLVVQLIDESQDMTEDVHKHFWSAKALLEYCEENKLGDVEHAQAYILKLVSSLRAHTIQSPARIGFHILLKLPRAETELDKSIQIASNLSAQKRDQFLCQVQSASGLNNLNNWLRGGVAFRSSLTQDAESKGSLIELNSAAMSIVNKASSSASQCSDQQPSILLLQRLTYDDLYYHVLSSDLDEEFEGLKRDAETQCVALGMTPSVCFEGMLTQGIISEIEDVRKLLSGDSDEDHAISDIQTVVNRVGSYQDDTSRSNLLQKMLFVFRKALPSNTSQSTESRRDSARLLLIELVEGLRGRCPDGQNSFFDDWLVRFQLQRFDSDLSPVTYVQHSIARLLLDWKQTFIRMHTSPFLPDVEERTVLHALLQNMLRLPLSLPGHHTQVLYPTFAFQQLKDAAAALRIEELMNRFLNGGSLVFERDPEQGGPVIRTIPGLSLQFIGRIIREALVSMRPSRSSEETFEAKQGNFLPPPAMALLIPEKVITDFVAQDPVLAGPYADFLCSHYTTSNVFFDAEGALLPGGAALRNIMRDASVLRLLEVAGYVILPPHFFDRLSQRWTFP